MKLLINTILILLISNIYLNGQTDVQILQDHENLDSWQTPNTQIDSILNSEFTGGKEKFLEIIYKNIKLESIHKDHWVQNYLVEIKASKNNVSIKFRNIPIELDERFIEEAISLTAPHWRNDSPINLKILVSSDVAAKFNNYISKAYVQINMYRTSPLSDCNIEDHCIFENKEQLQIRINNLLKINEIEAAIYYQKILVRRFPFSKELNLKLQNLISSVEK